MYVRNWKTDCLGAVVLTCKLYNALVPIEKEDNTAASFPTLKPTGVWLGFLILNVCETSVVNGPATY